MRPEERLRALRALAADQRGTPEGALAERMAARLEAAGVSVATVVDEVVGCRDDHDRMVLSHVACYLGVRCVAVGYPRTDGKGVRWRRSLSLSGPPDAVAAARELYLEQRDRLRDLLYYAAAGYLLEAMPLEAGDEPPPRDEPPPTEAQLAAYRGGAAAADHLPNTRRITG